MYDTLPQICLLYHILVCAYGEIEWSSEGFRWTGCWKRFINYLQMLSENSIFKERPISKKKTDTWIIYTWIEANLRISKRKCIPQKRASPHLHSNINRYYNYLCPMKKSILSLEIFTRLHLITLWIDPNKDRSECEMIF